MNFSKRGIGTSLAFAMTVAILVAGTVCVAVLSSASSQSTTSTAESPTLTTTSTSSSSTGTTVSSTATTSTSTVASAWTSTSAVSEYGLDLGLAINAVQFPMGSTIEVNVSEFNALDYVNNVSRSSDWFVPVALGSCPNLNSLPIGIAVYQGHYTAANVSQGTQLHIFPVTPCPMLERYISGYSFQADSGLATVLPGSGLVQVTGSVDVVNGTSVGMGQTSPLGPGQYTVVGADEWGAAAFLYFQVEGPP